MLITSRDLLKVEYLIGYDCIVGIISELGGFALRTKLMDENTGKDLFFQRVFTSHQLEALRVNKNAVLSHYADEAKHNLEQYMAGTQS